MLGWYVCGAVLILGSHQISSSSRFSLSLDGVWKFKLSPATDPEAGFTQKWYTRDFPEDEDTLDMPVPSSFNDIPTDPKIRDFVGWVWYQRSFTLPHHISPDKTYTALKFGSVEYFAKVWIGKYLAGEHEGGHIPFEFDVTEFLSESTTGEIRITVAVNNTLNPHTIPQGSLTHVKDKDNFTYTTYTHNFDYFDYAGLNGNVKLLFMPTTHVSTVEIQAEPNKHQSKIKTATLQWVVKYANIELIENPIVRHTVLDPRGKSIFAMAQNINNLRDIVKTEIKNPELWWPRSTFPKAQSGVMYTLQIVINDRTELVDSFSKKFGIRVLEVNGTNLLLNGEQVYLKGFGMHQDADIRGRGFDPVHLVRDFNLLKWSGANAIRTSHYPYPVEFLEMADKHGIMVILEAPACSLSSFDEKLLSKHKKVLTEMRKVYGSHPSVVMWSLANEPQSNDGNSTKYFGELIKHIKSIDSRPVTFVTSQQIENEKAVQNIDVICLNRYQGWYSMGGRLDLIQHHVTAEIQAWKTEYNKPVILTEYGAESLSGYHSLPSTMWTENYQIDLFHEHFTAFDALRQEGALSGEMIWNFADFKVPQEYFRAEFCDKGIFTRNRQPKSAAYTVKLRYEKLVGVNNTRML